MSETTGVKACPWCKYPPVLTNIIKDGTWYAECFDRECERHMRTAPLGTKSSAIEAWNLMVDEQAAHDGLESDPNLLEPDSNLLEPKLCELEETERFVIRYDNQGIRPEVLHILECSECGRTCEHVNGTYPRCPYCSAVNVLDENYEPQVIKNAENYKLADDSRPQVIANAEKYELTDDAPPVKLARLLNCLERDYGIKASWDGLRCVWLTELAEPLPVDNAQADSREQLEADAKTLLFEFGGYCANSREGHTDNVDTFFDDFIGLLDRQAAITRADVFEDGGFDCMTCGAKRELQERVDSLTAELDKANESGGKLFDKLIDMTAERDDLREQLEDEKAENGWTREFLNRMGPKCGTADCPSLVAYVNNLESERDYWKDQVHQCVMKAVEPGGYTAGIMRYPRTDGYCEPSLIVTDEIVSLKDFYADEKRVNAELTAERDELDDDCERYRRDLNEIADALGVEIADDAETHAREMAAIEKLTAERNELRLRNAELEAERCDRTFDISRHYDKAKERVAELEAELAHKQHVCDVQRESFRKMERELAEAKAADYTAMKDEIEKLGKQVAELKAENRDLCMKIYGAPF